MHTNTGKNADANYMVNSEDYKSKPVFTISIAARLLQVSIPTLRLYEKEGLLLPYKKSSGHRLYSEADLERVKFLRRLINQDKISINAIKLIFSILPCWIITGCNELERNSCHCFTSEKDICWNSAVKPNRCDVKNCRDCKVYTDYFECDKIKALLTKLSHIIHSSQITENFS